MAYVSLRIGSGDDEVDRLFRQVIEPYLLEVHYLLAATWSSDRPDSCFIRSCATMLFATVAATSALPNYQRGNQQRSGDKVHFVKCLRKYLPWSEFHIEDDQHRCRKELDEIASETLYSNFRCPMFHSGGLVASSDLGIKLVQVHPGESAISVAEQRIETLAAQPGLNQQPLLKLEFRRCTLYVDCFYWCVRKLVERAAADPDNARQIRDHSLRGR